MFDKDDYMRFATFRYALINIFYFMVFCGIHAYSSVFLLEKGFTNTQIGIVLALANIVSVVLQPLIAGIIDKPGPVTNRRVSIVATLILMIGSVVLFFVKNSFLTIFIVFMLIYMVQMVYQPILLAMCFEYKEKGEKIKFGLARGLGSFGFAVTSIFFGRIISKQGTSVIMLLDAGILFLLTILLFTFVCKENEKGWEGDFPYTKPHGKAHNNFFEFVRYYPRFSLVVLGAVCFFFAHNAINDYFIQIIKPIGGDEAKMGIAIFAAAALELPTMACIGTLMKKASCATLLRIAGVFFLIKTVLMLFATGMTGVFLSQICQMGAYALFIPTSAYYVEEEMEELDAVKGQAYISVSITLGGVFSNLICGRILDVSGVHTMLTTATIVTFVGLIIVFFAVGGKKKEAVKEEPPKTFYPDTEKPRYFSEESEELEQTIALENILNDPL